MNSIVLGLEVFAANGVGRLAIVASSAFALFHTICATISVQNKGDTTLSLRNTTKGRTWETTAMCSVA